jgi:hypothetical protein
MQSPGGAENSEQTPNHTPSGGRKRLRITIFGFHKNEKAG